MPGTTAAAVLNRAGVDPAHLGPVMPRVDPAGVPVRVAPWWLRTMWLGGISAMTLPWAVYVDPEVWERFEGGSEPGRDARLMVHELMHVEQVRRHGAIRHTLRYGGSYVRGRVRGLGHWDAYRAVSFEQEARAASRLVMEYM
jgi:hypothetical protein